MTHFWIFGRGIACTAPHGDSSTSAQRVTCSWCLNVVSDLAASFEAALKSGTGVRVMEPTPFALAQLRDHDAVCGLGCDCEKEVR
jgi:hypothetical protein